MIFRVGNFVTAMILVVMLVIGVQLSDCVMAESIAYADELELGLVEKLEIIKAGDFSAESCLTRAQTCEIALKIMNYDYDGEAFESVFTDVGENDDYFNDIMTASGLGIINGYPDGTFRPEDEVSVMQFYKIVIEVLGYGDFALVSGGYPVGYLKFVDELDIDDGVRALPDEKITYADVIKIICNALGADVCDISSVYISNGEIYLDFGKKDGETLLSKYHKINKITGICTATAISGIDSPLSALSENEISVDGKVFRGCTFKDYEMLGYCIDLYYTDDDKFFFGCINSGENYIEKIDAKTIVDFDERTNTYEFEENGKDKRKAFSKSVDVIVNEKACPDYIKSDMLPSTGAVYLIDNNGDSKTDTVKVESYEHYVISAVDSINGIVYAKNRDDAVVIDIEDGKTVVAMAGGMKEFSYSDLVNDSVMSIAMSKSEGDTNYSKIQLSSQTASGEISEISDDFKHVSLGGEEYSIDEHYAVKLGEEKNIVPGVYAVLRIDAFGDVVYIDTDAIKGKNYAFLLDVSKETGGIAGEYKVRLLGSDGEVKTFKCRDKININNSRVEASQLEARLTYLFVPGNVYTVRQLVTFETNASGLLTKLETYDDFGKNLISGINVRGDLFGKGTRLESDVPVFRVPDDENINTTDIKNGFSVSKAVEVTADIARTMEFFDYDDFRFASAAVDYVTYGSKTTRIDGGYLSLFLVDKVTRVEDEEGDEVYKLTGTVLDKYNEEVLYDEFITYRDRSGNVLNSYTPKAGDVIIYSENSMGKVNCIYRFYTKDSSEDEYFIHSTHTSKRYDHMLTIVGGRVMQYRSNGDMVMLSSEILAMDTFGATVTILTDKGFAQGTLADISVGDRVVCRLSYGVAAEVVIIRD